ncbi:hypothetical protein MPTK1_4g09400 [Marchantia polymorpha subsp. ruderalis]|uniref:Uncharacterized protein n=2 Tax=Marchantia polymorpha TaxID=3197 RepID=A0AAF6B833_MARPO|nr:hypothetical protein MARPO_0112s0040 [Marchantia polymorpha]BBN08167.1 hypothetical protein Mp_4g09400 [Marchantia polymorpha subsp. ruderalis]|eukprot:PTQ31392.1 hypothetical protein MARPO_0112s0040 [Marchantia polymorpha]
MSNACRKKESHWNHFGDVFKALNFKTKRLKCIHYNQIVFVSSHNLSTHLLSLTMDPSARNVERQSSNWREDMQIQPLVLLMTTMTTC